MLLSIDRVLQLLAEGKTVTKIAEMAGCAESDVIGIIEETRRMMALNNKSGSRKKLIIRKNPNSSRSDIPDDENMKKIFQGAELSAVPVESILVIYAAGVSLGNPGPAGIGIVILDKEDRQVGKVSCPIGTATEAYAEFASIIRAISIAQYFNTRSLKIRTDAEHMVRQISGEHEITNQRLKKMAAEIESLKKKIPSFRIELIMRPHNDKADYLARQAASAESGKSKRDG